jgi:hypothetical protein
MTRSALAWIVLALSGILGSMAALAGVGWLTPILQAVPAWWILVRDLREGRAGLGVVHMVFWSVLTSIAVITLTRHRPGAVEAGILHGAAYRDEMFTWIRTGVGAEGDPSRFLPEHAFHYGLVLVLSFVTAGLAGLLLGAVLLNYMNFYVGALIAAAHSPALAGAVGWPPWSCLRVLGFTCGAIAMAGVLLGRVLRRAPWQPRTVRRLFVASAALVVADVLVKAVLAPHWRVLLGRAVGE